MKPMSKSRAAREMGVGIDTINAMIAAGTLKTVTLYPGARVRVIADSFREQPKPATRREAFLRLMEVR